MIVASELRIGNLVIIKRYISMNTNGEEKFELIETTVNFENIQWKKCIQPIPLTEEWLVKFGFEEKEDLNSKDYPFAHSIFTKSSKSILCNEFKIGGNQNGFHFYSMVYINYVHQLQNLYFALTGEELTIKN